jgi:hypothetical protein
VSTAGGIVQVAFMNIINVTFVLDRDMAALWTVLVPLVRMNFWLFHNKN